MSESPIQPDVWSLAPILAVAPWVELEQHIDQLRESVDSAVPVSNYRREHLRVEMLSENPALRSLVRRQSRDVLGWAKGLLRPGIVTASDGTGNSDFLSFIAHSAPLQRPGRPHTRPGRPPEIGRNPRPSPPKSPPSSAATPDRRTGHVVFVTASGIAVPQKK
jgi:hypothetical protein